MIFYSFDVGVLHSRIAVSYVHLFRIEVTAFVESLEVANFLLW